ncbi:hypothetical protein Zm00014a_001066 [Zea mays]|jgi:hypothetical protein|uniref:Uncharacterized protein n=2 Tax=Zea mays TaxID=4577 RepID=A0A1D6KPF3_MAIZE|nr:hypothetical protein ZEAMMB73_Zm00001d032234 [Zea mays]PWZ53451.1 hypothetical protein Zm00014a_001066 [Zea mays]
MDNDKSEVSPAARVQCEGVVFTVTKGNEVARVTKGGEARVVLSSESYFDADTCTRHHFVDVQGKAEAMLFFVSVREDLNRIVSVRRFS